MLFAEEYCCWGPLTSLSIDSDVPRVPSGLGMQGTGGGIGDDVAAWGNDGGGETTRWGANGVVLGNVYGLGSFLGRGSSFMGNGRVVGTELGDPVVVRPFFVDVGVSTSPGLALGVVNDGVEVLWACTAICLTLETSWLQTFVVTVACSIFVDWGRSSLGGSVWRAAH